MDFNDVWATPSTSPTMVYIVGSKDEYRPPNDPNPSGPQGIVYELTFQ
jgi:hypothetical protein